MTTQYACYVLCLCLCAHRSANNALYLASHSGEATKRGQIRQILSKMALKCGLFPIALRALINYIAFLLFCNQLHLLCCS